MQSFTESMLAAVQARLVAAGLNAERGRVDGFALSELPAIAVRRAETTLSAFGPGVQDQQASFELDCHTAGADWETTADALHMAAHQALISAGVSGLAELTCERTTPQAESGDAVHGRITATYTGRALVRQASLTAVG